MRVTCAPLPYAVIHVFYRKLAAARAVSVWQRVHTRVGLIMTRVCGPQERTGAVPRAVVSLAANALAHNAQGVLEDLLLLRRVGARVSGRACCNDAGVCRHREGRRGRERS